jgi:Domain of unknown function (DUF4785)
MKKTLLFTLISAAVAASCAVTAASASDIIPTQLRAAVASKSAVLPGMTLSRDTVQYSWNLDGEAVHSPAPFKMVSREYFVEVSAADMRGGVAINTSAPGSVIKLTPRSLKKSAALLNADDIIVRVGGQLVPLASFSSLVDDSNKFSNLAKRGVAFAPGSLAFQVNEGLGATSFQLAVKNAGDDYLVHVFEPASANAISLTTTRDAYLTGESVSIRASGVDAGQIMELSGGIASPTGEITPLSFTRNTDSSFVGSAPLSTSAAGTLFEAFVVATMRDGNVQILRDAKVGFAVADATVRSLGVTRGGAGAGAGTDMQSFNVSLEVATAGRYSAEAVLYGLRDGKRQPIAMTQTGAWLETGNQNVNLRFDNLDLNARGITGPFTLGHMVLKNQGTLQVVERRAEVAITERERGPRRGAALD